MVLIRFGLAAFFSFALCAETAFGASTNTTFATTGISLEVTDQFNRNEPTKGFQLSDSETDDNGGDPVAANANITESWGRAFGDITGSATAGVGDLGVKFIGTAQVTSILNPAGFSTSSRISALAVAEWQDLGTVESDFPVGPLILNGSLTLGDPVDQHVDGGFFATFTDPLLSGGAGGSLKIESLGNGVQFPAAPYPDGNWATLSANGSVSILNPAPTSIPVRIIMDPDVSFTIGYRMTLRGEASAGAATTIFGGDFSGSLHWGGIQSVTDLFGNAIPDDHWRITSASGFDYSKPFSVPEPAAFALAVPGMLVLIALAGRRRAASKCDE